MISQPPAQAALKSFVYVELETNRPEHRKNLELMNSRFKSIELPLYIILAPDGTEKARMGGAQITEQEFLDFLKKA